MVNDPIYYTYMLGWKHHNKWYYGVQYNNKADPRALWNTYFTSSKYVKEFRQNNGEPDFILICETFDEPIKAKQWEDDVLLSVPKNQRSMWINKRFGSFKGIVVTDEMRKKNGLSHSGPKHSNKMKEVRFNNPNWGSTKGYTNEYRRQNNMGIISGKPLGSKESDTARKKKSETGKTMLTIQDLTGKYYRVKRNLGLDMITSGLYQMGGKGSKGKCHTELTKQKLREVAANRPTYYCDICGRSIKGKMNWDKHLISNKHLSQSRNN